ncbi:MAG: hypothetical protein LBE08_06330 [Bifidobacteriaceae bacterium]|jgi:hypothetical protein|nr:hypothetical protein [Bifidobacteriaceae bacterium]
MTGLRKANLGLAATVLAVGWGNIAAHLLGLVDQAQFQLIWLAVELPLGVGLVVTALVCAVQAQRRELPTLWLDRAILRELQVIRSALGPPYRRSARPATHFGYTKGGTGIVVSMLVLCTIEIIVVALVVDRIAFRIALAALALYAAVTVLGLIRERERFPHRVANGALELHWGRARVARIHLDLIERCYLARQFKWSYTGYNEGVGVLTPKGETNVALRLTHPIAFVLPRSAGRGDVINVTDTLALYLETPQAFIAQVNRSRLAWGGAARDGAGRGGAARDGASRIGAAQDGAARFGARKPLDIE